MYTFESLFWEFGDVLTETIPGSNWHVEVLFSRKPLLATLEKLAEANPWCCSVVDKLEEELAISICVQDLS